MERTAINHECRKQKCAHTVRVLDFICCCGAINRRVKLPVMFSGCVEQSLQCAQQRSITRSTALQKANEVICEFDLYESNVM